MSRRRKEPEVIVFEEPTVSSSKKGKEAAREREKFLVGCDTALQIAYIKDNHGLFVPRLEM